MGLIICGITQTTFGGENGILIASVWTRSIILHILKQPPPIRLMKLQLENWNKLLFLLASERKGTQTWVEITRFSPARLCTAHYSLQQVVLVTILGCVPLWHEVSKEQDHEADHRPLRPSELISSSDLSSVVDITPPTCGYRRLIGSGKGLGGGRVPQQTLSCPRKIRLSQNRVCSHCWHRVHLYRGHTEADVYRSCCWHTL